MSAPKNGNTILNLGEEAGASELRHMTETFDWDQLYINLSQIEERPGFNPRTDYGEADGSFASLVESIRDRGMLELPRLMPIVDKHGDWDPVDCHFTIVLGHRRIAAARALGWQSVRVCVPDADGKELAAYDDSHQLVDALIENLQRKELNCIEVAEGIARLERMGKTQSDIARWIGRDQGRVSKTVRLLELPVGVRSLLRDGGLSASHGEELLPLLSECFLPGEIERLAHDAVEMGLTKSGLRNVVQDKIKKSQPVQTTIEEVGETGAGASELRQGDYAPAHNSQVGKTEHVKSQGNSDPKPAPKDDNGLTRKEADAQFAAAMAPDSDVVPLSSLPAPVPAPQGQVTGVQEEGVDAGTVVWAQSVFGSIQSALDKLESMVGADSENAAAPGMWFRLEPETAQKLMELCDWHRQEHGDISDRLEPMTFKLNEVVNSFHAAKLEMRAEAEAVKAALAATLPVFEVPEVQKQELSPSLEDDAFFSAFWRCLANHGYTDKLLAFTLPTTRGTVRRFSEMLSEAIGEWSYWGSPGDGWVSGEQSGGKYPSVKLTYREGERSREFVFKSGDLLDMAEKTIAWRRAQITVTEAEEPAPAPTDLYETPQGIADGLDEFAGRLV